MITEGRWKCRYGMVPVWYGDVRETERDEICYFGEWEMEEWQDSEIWHFRNCLCLTAQLRRRCQAVDSGYGGLEEGAVREQRQRKNFDFQKKGKCCFDGGL